MRLLFIGKKIIKYFNYQKYKYITKKYKNPIIYAKCAKNYNTNKYTKNPKRNKNMQFIIKTIKQN
jgi:hypothetical protein